MKDGDDNLEGIEAWSIKDGSICWRDPNHKEGEGRGFLAGLLFDGHEESDSSVYLDGVFGKPN